MSVLSSGVDAVAVAHAVHYGVIGVAVVGAAGLVLSRALAERRDSCDGTEPARAPATTGPSVPSAPQVLLPLAVAASAAAAGVHAAVGPAHFREGTLFALFFAGSALLQLLWAGAVTLRCARPLLVAGAVGNLAVLALWGVTRTVGLPFGLLPTPEAVGPWDLACAGWELLVAGCCVAVLLSRETAPARLVGWGQWHPAARWFVAGSALGLVALSLSGASA